MLYRIIDEHQVEQFPLHIEVLGDIYTNSLAEEEAVKTGEWFELVEDNKPNYNPETEYLTKRYYQDNDIIRLEWTVNEKGENEDASI